MLSRQMNRKHGKKMNFSRQKSIFNPSDIGFQQTEKTLFLGSFVVNSRHEFRICPRRPPISRTTRAVADGLSASGPRPDILDGAGTGTGKRGHTGVAE